MLVPIITIDGPASSGKGTVAKILAKRLGYHYLESGAIYRALAWWAAYNYGEQELSSVTIVNLIATMNLQFSADKVYLNQHEISRLIRDEKIGMLASQYAAGAEVRQALLQFQRNFAQPPGLITDGRDMGSVVFPQARLKVFLTASAEKRAERRYKQLQYLDKSATIGSILQDIKVRDQQDSQRRFAPLSYDASFKVLDNSELSIEETINLILNWYRQLD
jgi:cytidylate kinase